MPATVDVLKPKQALLKTGGSLLGLMAGGFRGQRGEPHGSCETLDSMCTLGVVVVESLLEAVQ